MQYSDTKKNPYRWLVKNSFEVILWLILSLFFKYNIYIYQDFRFLPLPVIIILTVLSGKAIIRPFRQYWLRVDSKKLYTFKEWKLLKQQIKTNQ